MSNIVETVATPNALTEELNLLDNILFDLKIEDITLTPTKKVGDFRAKDEEGNRWKNADEFYDFLINEAFVYMPLVATIEFIDCGKVRETMHFTNAKSFVEYFKEQNYHGVPMQVIFYENSIGEIDDEVYQAVKNADPIIMTTSTHNPVETILGVSEERVEQFIQYAEKRGKKLPITRF